MKLYTFLFEDSQDIITQVIAENHDQAVAKCGRYGITFQTDFYSETLNDNDEIVAGSLKVNK